MGVKKLQGADGMNFEMQMTVAGLEGAKFNEELKNKAGNDIIKVNCWGGRLSAFVNLPHAIRPNNVQPFQLSDCIKIELVRNQVVEFMHSCLQKNLKDKYSEEFLSQLTVTKLECNLTIKCVGACKARCFNSLQNYQRARQQPMRTESQQLFQIPLILVL